MIGYTCKYTPVELLAALGGQPALLNREANAFSHAEALTHNHFCCHAKAVLEECRRDGVRELVLVNCCDSIRRCYDVLRAQGGLDFLFLLDLPHPADGGAHYVDLTRDTSGTTYSAADLLSLGYVWEGAEENAENLN